MDNPPEVELVLPCLDEATGLRWLLPRVPPGIAVILADNGSTDGSARDRAGPRRHDRRRSAARVRRRLPGRAARRAGRDRRGDGRRRQPGSGPAGPGPGSRPRTPPGPGDRGPPAGAAWGSAVAPAAGQPCPGRTAGRSHRGPVARSRTDAGGAPHGSAGARPADRRSGYPAETVVKAADAGWRIGEVWVDYRVGSGRSKVTGTPRGVVQAVRDMSAALTRPVA